MCTYFLSYVFFMFAASYPFPYTLTAWPTDALVHWLAAESITYPRGCHFNDGILTGTLSFFFKGGGYFAHLQPAPLRPLPSSSPVFPCPSLKFWLMRLPTESLIIYCTTLNTECRCRQWDFKENSNSKNDSTQAAQMPRGAIGAQRANCHNGQTEKVICYYRE